MQTTNNSTPSSGVALDQPLELAPGLKMRNRTIMGSLTRNRAGDYYQEPTSENPIPRKPNTGTQADGVPTIINAEHYRQRARGGFGLILSEGAMVEPQGTEWIYAPGIWTEEQVAGWKLAVDAVHAEGGLIFCQLWHVGRVSHPEQKMQKVFGNAVRAPSNVSARGGKFRDVPGKPPFVAAPELEDPSVVVEAYRLGAKNAKKAGFDGVELHSANGYLCPQFMDKYANVRTDKYGGSAENRIRFPLECLDAILSVWPAERVGIKLSPTGGLKDLGMDANDTVETYGLLLSELAQRNLTYIQMLRHAMDVNGDPVCGPGGPEKEGEKRSLCPDLDLDATLVQPFRKLLDDGRERRTKIFWVGGFGGKEKGGVEASEWLEQGRADGIVFSTDSITNPDLPYRIFNDVPITGPGGGDPKRWYTDGSRGKGDGYTEMFSEQFLKDVGPGKVLFEVGAN